MSSRKELAFLRQQLPAQWILYLHSSSITDMKTNPLDKLQRLAKKAEKRDLQTLAAFCRRATCLEGNLYRFAARAAMAELAENWFNAATDQKVESLAQTDIPRVIDEMERFLGEWQSEVYQPPEPSSS